MNKLNKITAAVSTAVTMAMLYPVSAFGAENRQVLLNPGNDQFNVLASASIGGLVSGAIRLLLVAAALLFFFMLVIGGIQWIIAGGDKTGAENARKRITSALVGLAIVFVAWAIVNLVNLLFGVNILNLTVPNLVGNS